MRVKLITKEIQRALESNPLYSHENAKPEDVEVLVKLFNPQGAGTWYITEFDPKERICFGLCCIQEAEPGYVSLDELEAFRGRLGLPIERDRFWRGTLADAMRAEGLQP